MLQGSYNSLLVLFSLLVAVLAAYTSLEMAGRIMTATGRAARWWLTGGAFAMGLGIWSMHFVGMLAFSLPIRLGYDPMITLASLSIAVASSAFALWLVCQEALPAGRLACGAVLMGLGVAGMHYTGMSAMRMEPGIVYDVPLFATSIVIAIAASGVALKTAFSLRHNSRRMRPLRAGAAIVMGLAIVGMHYTGMSAAGFPAGSFCVAATEGGHSAWVAVAIIIVTLTVTAVALTISVLEDLRLETENAALTRSLAQANQELGYLALHDALTKLPNRVLLECRLDNALSKAHEDGGQFALMFMDLDGFKVVNDAYGHQVGDRLLVQVAERLAAAVRGKDTLARVGGDEFVLLVPDEDQAGATAVASRLLAAISAPFQADGHDLRISTSIGIAMCPADGASVHDALMHADAAMYHAKSMSRNAHCFFDTSMNENMQGQLQLTQDLRAAIERNELVLLHYQPQFAAPDGPIRGVEALVRWIHPKRGLIGPDEFIPLAEKTGLIVPIGEWVLDEACRQVREWLDSGTCDWNVAVNLSPVQFSHPQLTALVRDTLERHRVEPRHLTIEVTESAAMRDVDASLRILQTLHDMGVRISIDDFGTGYSSLMYLKRLPASELKIDRGFVRELAHDAEDAAIVSSVVALGQTLGIDIVAEGVETTTQKEFLTRLGCNSLQGFLLGRPVPAAELDALSRECTQASVS
ncbi:putative bifunctional diguanylate cyclase/phosphodiesterase [Paraburkholderia sabiae]|uniref:EAL domain-containing protein n=1 Tax=Paraburkholderia sabiae TaxID=273251 RepID=A0ABU9Q8E1_9BURK|nr:bifunctional diguanylate cyclase/phosphodiesterase [Paraburkholderia sabiae]WJZ78297.1 EAL domain-containing protein [Paraburkholderia sabiae]CAD6506964.1 putative signaling protein [Paraburkholderia sabiae]